MNYRKQLYSVVEVGSAMTKARITDWQAVLLSDLQQGVLTAVVSFPSWRNGLTLVPTDHWSQCQGGLKARGQAQALENVCNVNDFYGDEEDWLRQAVLAVSIRITSGIPPEYRGYMENTGRLKEDMTDPDWHQAARWLSECWEELSNLSGRDLLHPAIEATRLNRYLLDLAKDAAINANPEKEKDKGGRHKRNHWSTIDEQTIRALARRSRPPRDGDVQQFARHIYNKVKTLVTEKEEPIPKPETIAARLRTLINVKDHEEDSDCVEPAPGTG